MSQQVEPNKEVEKLERKVNIDNVTNKLLDASLSTLNDLVDILYDEAKLGVKKLINWINE